MESKSFNPVIARRELRPDGVKPVQVLIGRPHLDAETGKCICPYQVTGVGDERVRGALAVDEFEAIGHAV